MKTRALIVEHDVVRSRHAHDKIATRDAQQRQQIVHVILIGLRVIGVTHVTAHRQPEQLAAEMIFEPRASDLLAVVQILRPDEPDDRVHQ